MEDQAALCRRFTEAAKARHGRVDCASQPWPEGPARFLPEPSAARSPQPWIPSPPSPGWPGPNRRRSTPSMARTSQRFRPVDPMPGLPPAHRAGTCRATLSRDLPGHSLATEPGRKCAGISARLRHHRGCRRGWEFPAHDAIVGPTVRIDRYRTGLPLRACLPGLAAEHESTFLMTARKPAPLAPGK